MSGGGGGGGGVNVLWPQWCSLQYIDTPKCPYATNIDKQTDGELTNCS